MKSLTIVAVLTLGLSRDVSASQGNALLAARMPEPTPAPNPANVARHLLKHRAVTADQSKTCGFVSGDYNNAVTCVNGYHCANRVSTLGGLAYSVAGCCADSGAACTLNTQCYDSSDYRSLTRSLNAYEMACTASGLYYCKKFVNSGYEALACGTASKTESVFDVASVTSPSSSYTTTPSSRSSSYSSSSSSSSSSSRTSPNPSPDNTSPIPTPTPTPNPAPVSASVSLSTGAIIGIAVAASAVVLSALVATIIICCIRQRRRRNNGPGPAPAPAFLQHGPSTAGAPVVTETGFNHVTQPAKEDRFSGQTYAGTPTEFFMPNKFENMPPLRPEDAMGEGEGRSQVGSNAGRTVTSVPSEGYNPPRV